MDSMTELEARPMKHEHPEPDDGPDARKALLAGLIGGVVATAGYLLYQRLEEEQKETIRNSVVGFVQEKISEIRSQLKM